MNNIEMIEFYLKQEGEKTLSKIKDCIDYLVPIITYKNYVQIYDSILNNDISREYKNLFHADDDSNYIRDCLLESIKRIIDDMSYSISLISNNRQVSCSTTLNGNFDYDKN